MSIVRKEYDYGLLSEAITNFLESVNEEGRSVNPVPLSKLSAKTLNGNPITLNNATFQCELSTEEGTEEISKKNIHDFIGCLVSLVSNDFNVEITYVPHTYGNFCFEYEV